MSQINFLIGRSELLTHDIEGPNPEGLLLQCIAPLETCGLGKSTLQTELAKAES